MDHRWERGRASSDRIRDCGTNDLQRAIRFYDALLPELGIQRMWAEVRRAAWGALGLKAQLCPAQGLQISDLEGGIFCTQSGVDKTLHDARGTFSTRLRMADVGLEDTAEIMGWNKDRVGRIIARYVEQDGVIRRMAERIRANESGTKTPK